MILTSLQLIAQCLVAQVYFSRINPGQLLLGPENVQGRAPAITTEYLKSIETVASAIRTEREFLEESTLELQRQEKQSREKKRLLRSQQALLDSLKAEEEEVSQLRKQWQKQWATDSTLHLLYDALQAGQCVQMETGQGRVPSSDVEMVAERPAAYLFTETMKVQKTEETTQWEKKPNPQPCHSSNPDDCMMYCLVKVPAQYGIFDSHGRLYEGIPSGFTEVAGTCIRTRQLARAADAPPVYTLKRRSDNVVLQVQGWQACNQK